MKKHRRSNDLRFCGLALVSLALLAQCGPSHVRVVEDNSGSGLTGGGEADGGGEAGQGGNGGESAGGASAGGRSGGGGNSSGGSGGAPFGAGGTGFSLPTFDALPTVADVRNCGLQAVPLERIPPEMVLVLDRSESMIDMAPGTTTSRWAELTGALNEVLMQTDGKVAWGLKTYPTTAQCEVGPELEVAVSTMSAVAIAAIQKGPPVKGNGTPTAGAVKAATAYLMTRTTPNPKYILLATDGEPTCTIAKGPANSIAAVVAAKALGISTFVVGLATAEMGSDVTLNAMAEAGGQARTGDPKYYPVANKKDLVDVLTDITNRVSTCTFPLSKDPPSPDDVAVNVDGKRVGRDKVNGWDYADAGKSIELFGVACDGLRINRAQKVEIIFGCPGVI